MAGRRRTPPDPPGMRTCSRCGVRKPANTEHFRPRKEAVGGLDYTCRECQNAATRAYRKTERGKQKMREQAARRRQEGRAARAKSKWRRSEKGRKWLREWASSPKGKESLRAASRRYYQSEKGRENARVKAERRRAAGKLPRDIYRILFDAQGGVCIYCECDLEVSGYHLEHLTPVSRGGDNSILENLRLACPKCNMSKGAKTWQEFMGVE